MNPIKVHVIQKWPQPISFKDVQSVHDLENFYLRFISILMGPNTDCLKLKTFHLVKSQQQSFKMPKQLLSSIPILAMPNFAKPFQVQRDAPVTSIGVVLSQEGKPIAFLARN